MVITTVLTRPKLAGIEANLEDPVLDNNVKIKLSAEMNTADRVVSRVVGSVVLLPEKTDKVQEMAKIAMALEEPKVFTTARKPSLPASNRSPTYWELFERLPAQPRLTFGARAWEWTGWREKEREIADEGLAIFQF